MSVELYNVQTMVIFYNYLKWRKRKLVALTGSLKVAIASFISAYPSVSMFLSRCFCFIVFSNGAASFDVFFCGSNIL